MTDLLSLQSVNEIKWSRVFAVPSSDTFDIPPIAGFVQKYLLKSKVSIDPFARNKRWATYTNDLNPVTAAQYHMDAGDFCLMLSQRNVQADLGIFDPPYSPRQVSECYAGIGKTVTIQDTQMVGIRRHVKNSLASLVKVGGVVLSFGWNSAGIGRNRGFEIIEILLVCHGAFHNDTICIAERRIIPEPELNLKDRSNETDGSYDGYWRPQDDPHIPDHLLSAAPVLTELESLQCKSIGQGCGTQPLEDIGGNWTPDRIEANEDRYGKPWYEREDWEVPGNGGTNDHLFEDDLFEDGDPQEYGDGSPD